MMNWISERKNFVACFGLALLYLLPVCRAEEASSNELTLVEMATRKWGPLTKAEETLFQKVVIGELADCSDFHEKNNGLNDAKKLDTNVIRAKVLAWLCNDKEASAMVTHKGISLKEARIDEELDLEFGVISFPLYFEKSTLLGGINIRYAEIRELFLIGTHTGPIYGDGVNIEGRVYLRNGFKAEGEVNLLSATIGGNLECDGSQFINPGGKALNIDGANIGGDVFLNDGFKAKGEVRLVGATIGGNLECDGSQFINPGKYALNADSVNIKSYVFLRNDFKAEGEVRLLSAKIGGGLDCDSGSFINPNDPNDPKDRKRYALNANGVKIEGYVYLRNGFKAEGEVNLIGATIGSNLECDCSQFINLGKYALNADSIGIKGHVFLRNGFKAEGEVNLIGARIGGTLDCKKGQFIDPNKTALNANSVKIEGNVLLRENFMAKGEVNLIWATIGGNLDCDNGQFIDPNGTALNADSVKIEGNVLLRKKFRAEGEVNLVGARIDGTLDCKRGKFINEGKIALTTNRANIGSSIYLSKGFKAWGKVDLIGATIGSDLDCSEGQFTHPNALSAHSTNIGGNVFFNKGFRAEGEVGLLGATIDGNLYCDNCQFIQNKQSANALDAQGIDVKGNVYFRNSFHADGKVNLSGAKIDKYFVLWDINSPNDVTLDLRSASVGTLYDDPKSWPDGGRLFLHGLVYKEIHDDAPMDSKSRIEWLQLQPDFKPQPYEQLADVLRKSGRESNSKDILIAKNKDKVRCTQLTRSEIPWYRVLGPMIGFGYRPYRALGIGILIILLGWPFFRAGYREKFMIPTKEAKEISVRFYPLVYSFDVFVPLVDLHQAKYFMPKDNGTFEMSISDKSKLTMKGKYLRYYLWFEITFGWILTTLLLVSLTGLIRT